MTDKLPQMAGVIKIDINKPQTISIWYQRSDLHDFILYTFISNKNHTRAYINDKQVSLVEMFMSDFFSAMKMVEYTVFKTPQKSTIITPDSTIEGKGYRIRMWSRQLSKEEISMLVEEEGKVLNSKIITELK